MKRIRSKALYLVAVPQGISGFRMPPIPGLITGYKLRREGWPAWDSAAGRVVLSDVSFRLEDGHLPPYQPRGNLDAAMRWLEEHPASVAYVDSGKWAVGLRNPRLLPSEDPMGFDAGTALEREVDSLLDREEAMLAQAERERRAGHPQLAQRFVGAAHNLGARAVALQRQRKARNPRRGAGLRFRRRVRGRTITITVEREPVPGTPAQLYGLPAMDRPGTPLEGGGFGGLHYATSSDPSLPGVGIALLSGRGELVGWAVLPQPSKEAALARYQEMSRRENPKRLPVVGEIWHGIMGDRCRILKVTKTTVTVLQLDTGHRVTSEMNDFLASYRPPRGAANPKRGRKGNPAGNGNLWPAEVKLLRVLEGKGFRFTGPVERRHTRGDDPLGIYDIGISGTYGPENYRFSAWLPLLAIRELTRWTTPAIANASDYPEMVREGDWSGIRDSETATIWRIFERFVLHQKPQNPRGRRRNPDSGQEARERVIYGMTQAQVEQYLTPQVRMFGGDWAFLAMAMLSDAQEMMARRQLEDARQLINRVKWVLDHKVRRDNPRREITHRQALALARKLVAHERQAVGRHGKRNPVRKGPINWNAMQLRAEMMSTAELLGALRDIQKTLPFADARDRENGTDEGGYYRDEASIYRAELDVRRRSSRTAGHPTPGAAELAEGRRLYREVTGQTENPGFRGLHWHEAPRSLGELARTRVHYESGRFLIPAILELDEETKQRIADYLVRIHYPPAYEAGTRENLIATAARELAATPGGQITSGPGVYWTKPQRNPRGDRPGTDRDFAIHTIRSALKRRSGKPWSVTAGRGTSWGWIHVDSPARRRTWAWRLKPGMRDLPENYEEFDAGEPGGHAGPAERAELARLLGLERLQSYQGVTIPGAHDYYEEYMDRAQGRDPSVIGKPYWDNPIRRGIDRRSIRTARTGILVGCPAGHYHPRSRRRRKCDVGMRAAENPRAPLAPGERVSVPYSGRGSYFGRKVTRTREHATVEGMDPEGTVHVRVKRGQSTEEHHFPLEAVRRLPQRGGRGASPVQLRKQRLELKSLRERRRQALAAIERDRKEYECADAKAHQLYPAAGEPPSPEYRRLRSQMLKLERDIEAQQQIAGELERADPAYRDPFAVNPRPGCPLERARQTFRMWQDRDVHGRFRKIHGPPRVIPRTLVKLGDVVNIDYRSNKYTGRPVTYTHRFKRPRPVLVTDPDARHVYLVGGRTKVTADGLVN